jgi:hypothetical protein
MGQAAPDTSGLTASLTIVGSSLTLPPVAVRNEMKADAEVTAGLQHHIMSNTTGMPLLPTPHVCLFSKTTGMPHSTCALTTPHVCLYCQYHAYASNTTRRQEHKLAPRAPCRLRSTTSLHHLQHLVF